ncbi:6,7-dimethyl-8-ribityllumazine synthase [Neisseriaceae bacterium PsAf]|nr:6,7-dimethyl-8-ribityllumazine synthase [Neisseriaceae bacterium PsAf]
MKKYPVQLKGKGLKVGIVQSRFSNGIGEELLNACVKELIKQEVKQKNITLVTVPGALEIPIALQNLLVCDDFDALIALGVVIRGETYHFELVADISARGISRVSLDFNTPIANAVLTTENDEQAIARARIKGSEAADVAIEMANHLKNLRKNKK